MLYHTNISDANYFAYVIFGCNIINEFHKWYAFGFIFIFSIMDDDLQIFIQAQKILNIYSYKELRIGIYTTSVPSLLFPFYFIVS